MHYDLTDLRLFLHAVATGSFSEGARRANISVSALSERMKSLEQQTGAKLFSRSARGSKLTPAGQEFAELARSVIIQTERLEGAVSAWRNRIAGSVHLLTNSNAIAAFLPEILARFLARYPDVELTIEEALSDDIASTIRAGEADVGIVASTANLDGLPVLPFRRDRLVAIVHAEHRLAARRRIGFTEILREPFVGLNEDAAIEKYLGMHARTLGHPVRSRIRLRSFDAIMRVVAANAGVAIIPASIAFSQYAPQGISVIELTDDWAVRNLVICIGRDGVEREEVSRLLEELTA